MWAVCRHRSPAGFRVRCWWLAGVPQLPVIEERLSFAGDCACARSPSNAEPTRSTSSLSSASPAVLVLSLWQPTQYRSRLARCGATDAGNDPVDCCWSPRTELPDTQRIASAPASETSQRLVIGTPEKVQSTKYKVQSTKFKVFQHKRRSFPACPQGISCRYNSSVPGNEASPRAAE